MLHFKIKVAYNNIKYQNVTINKHKQLSSEHSETNSDVSWSSWADVITNRRRCRWRFRFSSNTFPHFSSLCPSLACFLDARKGRRWRKPGVWAVSPGGALILWEEPEAPRGKVHWSWRDSVLRFSFFHLPPEASRRRGLRSADWRRVSESLRVTTFWKRVSTLRVFACVWAAVYDSSYFICCCCEETILRG